jgi:hypothetical protein
LQSQGRQKQTKMDASTFQLVTEVGASSRVPVIHLTARFPRVFYITHGLGSHPFVTLLIDNRFPAQRDMAIAAFVFADMVASWRPLASMTSNALGRHAKPVWIGVTTPAGGDIVMSFQRIRRLWMIKANYPPTISTMTILTLVGIGAAMRIAVATATSCRGFDIFAAIMTAGTFDHRMPLFQRESSFTGVIILLSHFERVEGVTWQAVARKLIAMPRLMAGLARRRHSFIQGHVGKTRAICIVTVGASALGMAPLQSETGLFAVIESSDRLPAPSLVTTLARWP